MEKSKRIKKEERRLNQIFVSVPDNKKKTVEGLIKRALLCALRWKTLRQT